MCKTYQAYRLMVINLQKSTDAKKVNAALSLMNISKGELSHSMASSLRASKQMREAALLATGKEFGIKSNEFFDEFGSKYSNAPPYSNSLNRKGYIKYIVKSDDVTFKVRYRIENNIIFQLSKYNNTKKRIGYVSNSENITKYFNLWTKPMRQKITILKNDLYNVDRKYVGSILNVESGETTKWKEMRVYDTNNVNVATIKTFNEFLNKEDVKYENHIVLKGELPFELDK
jgi:hypothetical protein